MSDIAIISVAVASGAATFVILAALKASSARWLDDSEVAHDFRRPGRQVTPSTGASPPPRTGGRSHCQKETR